MGSLNLDMIKSTLDPCRPGFELALSVFENICTPEWLDRNSAELHAARRRFVDSEVLFGFTKSDPRYYVWGEQGVHPLAFSNPHAADFAATAADFQELVGVFDIAFGSRLAREELEQRASRLADPLMFRSECIELYIGTLASLGGGEVTFRLPCKQSMDADIGYSKDGVHLALELKCLFPSCETISVNDAMQRAVFMRPFSGNLEYSRFPTLHEVKGVAEALGRLDTPGQKLRYNRGPFRVDVVHVGDSVSRSSPASSQWSGPLPVEQRFDERLRKAMKKRPIDSRFIVVPVLFVDLDGGIAGINKSLSRLQDSRRKGWRKRLRSVSTMMFHARPKTKKGHFPALRLWSWPCEAGSPMLKTCISNGMACLGLWQPDVDRES